MKKRILYVGNKLASKGATVTSIETLGVFLKNEGYKVTYTSEKKSKVLRLCDMLWTTFRLRKKTDIVLIDTYSTLNFYYAILVGQLCRICKIKYIPILRGGDLERRLKKGSRATKNYFNGSKYNLAPSYFLMTKFESYGYSKLIYIPNTIEIKNYPFLLRKEINR